MKTLIYELPKDKGRALMNETDFVQEFASLEFHLSDDAPFQLSICVVVDCSEITAPHCMKNGK